MSVYGSVFKPCTQYVLEVCIRVWEVGVGVFKESIWYHFQHLSEISLRSSSLKRNSCACSSIFQQSWPLCGAPRHWCYLMPLACSVFEPWFVHESMFLMIRVIKVSVWFAAAPTHKSHPGLSGHQGLPLINSESTLRFEVSTLWFQV